MDKELADALKEQRDLQVQGFARLEALIEKGREQAQAHMLEDARLFSKLEEQAKAAHRRIDEHLEGHAEEKRTRAGLWVGVILSALGALGSMLLQIFKGHPK